VEGAARKHHVRDAWLLVGIGVLIPICALAGAIWGLVQLNNGETKGIAISLVGFTVFGLRMVVFMAAGA
jgi:hypothetical protein